MVDILLYVTVALLAVVVVLMLVLLGKMTRSDPAVLFSRLDAFEKAQERTEDTVRDEMARSREESGKTAREQRQELTESFTTFGDAVVQRMMDAAVTQRVQLDAFSDQLAGFAKASGERLDAVRAESATGSKQLREEVITSLKGISETITKTMAEIANLQKNQLETMSAAIAKLSDSNEKKLEAVRMTVEEKLQSMQSDNAKQLDQMRQTVDEKLQGTLEKRLGESFKLVSERLELVHKGLGEMQSLATGVGDLKKVLTNVKTRGTWGEVQLGNILEQFLTADQYEKNVATAVVLATPENMREPSVERLLRPDLSVLEERR